LTPGTLDDDEDLGLFQQILADDAKRVDKGLFQQIPKDDAKRVDQGIEATPGSSKRQC
jgi:hypothetical protein